MKDVATQAERAGRILRGMRDLVRKGEMRKQRVEINQLVREVVPLAEIELKRVGVTLDLKLSAEPLVTLGVPIQIEQVIFNLVKNGIDAMRGIEGRVRRLTLETTINDSGTLQVSVADTGPGLPIQESQDRLFGPFFTTKPHGMGMGLPISRSIVETHGGRLWADSLPGGGAVFHFTLPRLRSPGTEQAALPGS